MGSRIIFSFSFSAAPIQLFSLCYNGRDGRSRMGSGLRLDVDVGPHSKCPPSPSPSPYPLHSLPPLSVCLCVTNNSIICENYVSSPFLRSKSKELSAGCELPAWHDIHHSLPKVHPVRFAVGDSSAFSPRLLLPHPSSFPSRPSPSPARPRPSIHSSGLSSVISFWLQEDNRGGSAELRRLVQSLRWQ